MVENPHQDPKSPATIHEATLASGPSGAVEWGSELSFEEAVMLRSGGGHIVVRGVNERANRQLAARIENAVGPATDAQQPHYRSAGLAALPHFQQLARTALGHSFYETKKRKARRRK